MFTWIQRYFQRHFGLIFALILAAMAVPLIVVFAPSSGIGQGDKTAASRVVFGYNLGSPEGQARLFGDANLSATLQLGYSGIDADQLQQYALQRAAAVYLADEMHIPVSTADEISTHIKGLGAFNSQEGNFDAQRYAAFRDSLKAGGQITEADVSRVIAADVRADKVRKILAGPGYVLDADVAAQLNRAETKWTLGVATVDYKSYQSAIKPTSDELAKFYGDNSFRYEITPRVRATYISFPASTYLNQVSGAEDEMKALFEAGPGRFQKPAADGKEAAPAGPNDYALVREQVGATIKLAKARRLATKEGSDLSLALFESKLANDPAVLASFLAAHKLKEAALQPFTRSAGPAELGHSAAIATAAFKLNQERFYSDAVPMEQGAVVLLWKETLPARTPLLNEVIDRVTTDYQENEKRKLFVALGKSIKQRFESRLKAGEEFAAAATRIAAATSTQITTKVLPAFTPANRPSDVDYSIFGSLETLEKGQLSEMLLDQEKGALVYAIDKVLPDTSTSNPQFAATREQIATMTARLGASKYLDEIVEKELRKSEPKLN